MNFKDLIVWQKSITLCEAVYTLCSKLPANELCSIADQMKRSSMSLSSNIAEGHKRNSKKE